MTLRTRTTACGARTTVVDRIERLRARGAIDALEVQAWPDEVVLSDSTGSEDAVETFERFEAWAQERGASIRPAFAVRTVSSLVGPSRRLLTLPMVSLELSVGTDLVGVFPHHDGERTWSVRDCLDAYDRRFVAESERDVPVDAGVEPVTP